MTHLQQTSTPRRLLGFAAVGLFHAGLIYLLLSGLGKQMVNVVEAPLMARIIVQKPPPPPPPPPKPHIVTHIVKAPPPPFVPPPEVKVAPPPAPNSIQVTTTVKPTHAAPPTPAPPAPVVVPDTDVSEQAVSGPPLQYPPSMVDLGVEGTADIECDVGTDGRTSNCKVLATTGDASFGEAALQHAATARFRPATHNGKPEASRHRWHVVFKLSQ